MANLGPVWWCSEFSCPSLMFLFTPELHVGEETEPGWVEPEGEIDLPLTDRGVDLQRLESASLGHTNLGRNSLFSHSVVAKSLIPWFEFLRSLF